MPASVPTGQFILAFFEPEVQRDTPFTVQYHYIPVPNEQPKTFHFTLKALYPGETSSVTLSGLTCEMKDMGEDQLKRFSLKGCKLNSQRDGDLCKLEIRVTTSPNQGNIQQTLDALEIRVVGKSN